MDWFVFLLLLGLLLIVVLVTFCELYRNARLVQGGGGHLLCPYWDPERQ